MKFDDYLEFRMFIRQAKRLTDREEIQKKLDRCVDGVVPDELYMMFDFSKETYLKEIKEKSQSKPFFKTLMKEDMLTLDSAKAVSSLLTHVMISASEKVKYSEKHLETVRELKDSLSEILDGILSEGEVQNNIKQWFDGIGV